MATKKKTESKGTIEQSIFGMEEFSISYHAGNSGVDHKFEGWIIEKLNDRFPIVTCDLEMSTRIRSINFRR